MDDQFHSLSATKTWFADQISQYPALPIVTVTRQDLDLWIDAEFDLPEVYELMVGYRQYLQLVHGDVMNINAIYEAFIEAAQEAGKLIIIEG